MTSSDTTLLHAGAPSGDERQETPMIRRMPRYENDTIFGDGFDP